jgi:predicted metal-dependent hydrolase
MVRFIAEPRRYRDHGIVHELLHLRLPNHGKLFKQLLSVHAPYPD